MKGKLLCLAGTTVQTADKHNKEGLKLPPHEQKKLDSNKVLLAKAF